MSSTGSPPTAKPLHKNKPAAGGPAYSGQGADESSDFAAMFAEFEGASQKGEKSAGRGKSQAARIAVGQEVKGRVLSLSRESVFVDLGGKDDGILTIDDVRGPDGEVTVTVGDEIVARVVEIDGRSGGIILRRMLGRADAKGTQELRQAFEIGLPVEGLVSAVVKGGVEVQVSGARAFCPISQLELRHVEDAAVFVGQRLRFKITRFEEGRSLNLVLSRRTLLEAEAQERAVELRKKLAVGVVLPGKVTALKDYGAFVDLGGVEGMLHISELSFQRARHPKDVLSVGQEIEVQVIKLEAGEGKKGERISLSLKSLAKDPWSDVETNFALGSQHAGTVQRCEDFGAFVELAPGIEGLLHISELADAQGRGGKLRHAKDAVSPGQKIDVVVKLIDREKRRMALELASTNSARREEQAAIASVAQASSAPQRFGTFGDLLSARLNAAKNKK
jgi:small subunit ribosomal protein S1